MQWIGNVWTKSRNIILISKFVPSRSYCTLDRHVAGQSATYVRPTAQVRHSLRRPSLGLVADETFIVCLITPRNMVVPADTRHCCTTLCGVKRHASRRLERDIVDSAGSLTHAGAHRECFSELKKNKCSLTKMVGVTRVDIRLSSKRNRCAVCLNCPPRDLRHRNTDRWKKTGTEA